MGSTGSDNGLFTKFQAGSYPVPVASTSFVQDLIHNQAKAHPHAEAIFSWDGTLTYDKLDSASTRLAVYLVGAGVKPESIVALLFEKSRWAVVSMLAVLKAGGAFMTLDVSQPESRLRSIIADGGTEVALASAGCFELCSSMVPVTFSVTERTFADLENAGLEDERQENISVGSGREDLSLNVNLSSRNAAYVMATSGSTGRPKLVLTEHSQLSSFITHLTKPLGFTSQTRSFQFASYAFDPIIGDIFLTLAAGGTVCIPSEEQRKSDIICAMNGMKVNLAKFTPSLVSSLPELALDNVPTLKTLILGGETTPATLLEAWADKLDLRLVYGSTECTISCVVPHAGTGTKAGNGNGNVTGSVIPGEIGRPYGSLAWVVQPSSNSADLQLVAQGEVGELVVEGPLVARGYMNLPTSNPSRFITGPTHQMYRTGDLVRQVEDGRLVYVGRVDNQVKIRAQRLELEEVEEHVRRALTLLDIDISIRNVLVDAAVPLGAKNKQLVALLSLETSDNRQFGALICGEQEGNATVRLSHTTTHHFSHLVSLLESNLRLVVPSYMVPSLWVPIDEMPYTLSRKRDRQRLRGAIESCSTKELSAFCRENDSKNLNGANDACDPSGHLLNGQEMSSGIISEMETENESLLRKLWSDVLDLDPESIQPQDHFFYLGGNSLTAMRLISMARRESQTLITDDVFTYPTFKRMALKLTPAQQSAHVAPFSLLEPDHRRTIKQEAAQQCKVILDNVEDVFPLYSMQELYVFGYPEQGGDSDRPWDWQQQIVFSIPKSLNIPLFKSIWNNAIKRHPQLRTRVVQTSHGVFQVALRNEAAPAWRGIDNLEEYISWDRAAANSMAYGDELLRLAITKPEQQPASFVLTMSHVIYDAYARDTLFKELEAAYLHQSSPETEPPSMSQIVNYVNTADRKIGIEAWTSYLNGSSTKALLSRHIGSQVGKLQIHRCSLTKPNHPFIKYTLATIIEASVALALAQILNCDDIIFYSDRAGRNLPVPGIQDLIAPTTLFLPLRIPINRYQTVHDLLCALQKANTSMIPHEYMGFLELRKLDHLKDILGHALNININPYTPLGKLGGGMGLTVVDEHETLGDPFAIDVSMAGDEMDFTVHFDESFVDEDVVIRLVMNIREMFPLVSKAYYMEQLSVGDVLQKLELDKS